MTVTIVIANIEIRAQIVWGWFFSTRHRFDAPPPAAYYSNCQIGDDQQSESGSYSNKTK